MYFKDFNNIYYDFTLNSDVEPQKYVVQDITTRVTTYADQKSLEYLTFNYIITNNEKPEQIAFNLYGNQYYHWTILYVNAIYDMRTQWPLSDSELSEYITSKYGANYTQIHHYKSMSTGIIGTTNDLIAMGDMYGEDDIVSVTNQDYEIELNERKRQIILIKPQYVGDFVSDFQKSLRQ